MPHELLDDAKVHAQLDEAGCPGVAKGVEDEVSSPLRPIATLALSQA
jgi:hypothetical protein